MSLAPTTSLDFSRSNARDRSVLHSPKDAWTLRTHDIPGIRQDQRGMNAASSPFRQNGVSRLASQRRIARCFASRSTESDWPHATLRIRTRSTPRGACSAPGDRQAPIFPPGERRWDSEATSGAAGQRERTALMSGHETICPSSWHAGGAIGRLTPRPWERADADWFIWPGFFFKRLASDRLPPE